MEEVKVQKTTSAHQVGNTNVVSEKVQREDVADPQEFTIAKVGQIVLYIVHVIAILLGLRFIFELLGANPRGIVQLVYNLSAIFVAPFRGIFPAPTTAGAYFDTAALLAIAIYYLLAFLIIKGIALLSRDTEA